MNDKVDANVSFVGEQRAASSESQPPDQTTEPVFEYDL